MVVVGVEVVGVMAGCVGPLLVTLGSVGLIVLGAKLVLERITNIAMATAIPIPIPAIDFLFKY